MNTKTTTLALLVSIFLVRTFRGGCPDRSPPDATATRPAKTPPAQTSLPDASPPPAPTQTTGETNQDATVKKMNEDEKQKVDTKGK